jgi:hypothetical protein
MYKICKKCISHARAPRGRDAWAALIDIKSYSTEVHDRTTVLNLVQLCSSSTSRYLYFLKSYSDAGHARPFTYLSRYRYASRYESYLLHTAVGECYYLCIIEIIHI